MALRMRTAEGALEIIKAADPQTAVTLRYIRRLIAAGTVPHVPVGRKKLINVDALLSYLEGRRRVHENQVHFTDSGISRDRWG